MMWRWLPVVVVLVVSGCVLPGTEGDFPSFRIEFVVVDSEGEFLQIEDFEFTTSERDLLYVEPPDENGRISLAQIRSVISRGAVRGEKAESEPFCLFDELLIYRVGGEVPVAGFEAGTCFEHLEITRIVIDE